MSIAMSRAQCCMLCCSPLYSPGVSIYHSKTIHGHKNFYSKLLEIANCESGVPTLLSDCVCSMCATMISQADQLEFQLGHLTSQIRTLFNKMTAMQTGSTQARAANTTGTGGSVGANDVASSLPTSLQASDDKKSSKQNQTCCDRDTATSTANNNNNNSNNAWSGQQPQHSPSATTAATTSTDLAVFNIGSFLAAGGADRRQGTAAGGATMAAAPSVSATGEFTDKFVRGIESDDVYRYQCVLCGRLGDCEAAIRQHVRQDHPGADRISFPGDLQPPATPPASKRRSTTSSSSAGKSARLPRSISASSHVMADNIARRLYVCVSCNKAFGCEAFLSRHVTAQSCGRLYSCDYCGREFTRSDKKVRHERSHTGERPFSCRFCSKTFSRRDKCTKHERSHDAHVFQPFDCPRCGDKMQQPGQFGVHRETCRDELATSAECNETEGSLWHAVGVLAPQSQVPALSTSSAAVSDGVFGAAASSTSLAGKPLTNVV